MRTLKLHVPEAALPTFDTFLKQTKEARVFRRAQAVRAVVKGQRIQNVSDALQFTYSALRKGVHRFANQGIYRSSGFLMVAEGKRESEMDS